MEFPDLSEVRGVLEKIVQSQTFDQNVRRLKI